MSDVLLPSKVAKEIQKEKWAEQRREHRAMLGQLFDFEDPVCREWNPHLKALDPLLRMGRARPLAYEPGYTVLPGFYHWVRDNETTSPTIAPITTWDEKFREPDSGVLEELRRNDLQNPAVFLALLNQNAEREKARAAEKEAERESRQQEIFERWQAGNRTQVLTSKDVPWTQSARARKAR